MSRTPRRHRRVAEALVDLTPAPGARQPTISADTSGAASPAGRCDRALLTAASKVFGPLESVTIVDGDASGAGVDDLGPVAVTEVRVESCNAEVGGAVGVGKGIVLTVTGSHFADDPSTYFDGAIDSGSVIGTVAGSGALKVTRSTLSNDCSQRRRARLDRRFLSPCRVIGVSE